MIRVAFESVCIDPTLFGAHGFGGYYRTAQIMKLLSDAGCDVELMDRTGLFFGRTARMRAWLQIRNEVKSLSFREQHQAAHCFMATRHVLKGGRKMLVTEGIVDRLKYHAAFSLGVPVVCFPECWTALLPGFRDSLTDAGKEDALKLQRRVYERVDRIGWISREELWLGRNLGIQGEYVPYYPCPEHHADLSAIRSVRQANGPSARFLIIATENNSDAPEIALAEQAKLISGRAEIAGDLEVDVVGYAADKYRHLWGHHCFNVHGKVPRDQLTRLMERCRALLVHGHQGIGTITRVVDCLVAGIPVVANGIAARSAYGLSGVAVYDSDWEFAEALGGASSAPCPPDPIELCSKARGLVDIVKGVWCNRFGLESHRFQEGAKLGRGQGERCTSH